VRSCAPGVIKFFSPAEAVQPDSKFEVSKMARDKRFEAPVSISYSESRGLHPAGALARPRGGCVASGMEVSIRTSFKHFIYNDNDKFCGARANFPLRVKSARARGLVSGGIIPGYPKGRSKTGEKGKNRREIKEKLNRSQPGPAGASQPAHRRATFYFRPRPRPTGAPPATPSPGWAGRCGPSGSRAPVRLASSRLGRASRPTPSPPATPSPGQAGHCGPSGSSSSRVATSDQVRS